MLRAAQPEFAEALAQYYLTNRDHLAPWTPAFGDAAFNVSYHRIALQNMSAAFEAGRAWRWYLFEGDQAETIAGTVQISQIQRGSFQSGVLGYSLAQNMVGKGYMFEAIHELMNEAFSERGRLHRIQANVRPNNQRSLNLMKRLEFQVEGLAPKYLCIAGNWEDHIVHSKISDCFLDEWVR